MNPLNLAKSVTSIIVSAGAAAVVGNAIKQSTPDNLKTTQKVSLAVGGIVLSSLVGSLASKHTNTQIDETLEQVRTFKSLFHKKTS